MFVDEVVLKVMAGAGGDGCTAFRREKYIEMGGPFGGNGGRGSDIVFQVDEGLHTLLDLRYQKQIKGTKGENGRGKNQHGKNSSDVIVKVPQGTVVTDLDTGLIICDLKHKGESFVVAKGGRGGKGNQHFANAVRQAPAFARSGSDGVEKWVVLELKMIADVGLLGFPNVGKSTFLSVVTKAKPKIANYHFTTLTPNLGVVQTKFGESFVLADIPGLIEGAAEGVGLGHDFLRHVERTKVLIHIVDISGLEGRDALDDFDKINGELKLYNEKLATRPQVVVANKMDILEDESIFDEFKNELEGRGYKVFKMSAATRQGVDDVIAYVSELLREAEEIELVSEEEMFRPELDEVQDEGLQIDIEDGVYVVTGKSLRRIMYSVNFDDMESLQYFQKAMESQGVFDRLREMGIEDGDTVRIYEIEFEFYN